MAKTRITMETNSGSSREYLKTVNVDWKANSGQFRYYDHEKREEVVTDSFSGVVVGSGYIFSGTVGRPTPFKSVSYSSQNFGRKHMEKGSEHEIYIHKFVMEKDKKSGVKSNSNEAMGRKTYAEWRDDEMRLNRTVFVLDPQTETLYRLIFGPITIKPISQQLNSELPNFYSTFRADESLTVSNDNGEFQVPSIKTETEIEDDVAELVATYVKKVHDEVNSVYVKQEEKPGSTPVSDLGVDDMPF